MKKIVLSLIVGLHCVFCSAAAEAAPCASSSLSAYLGLGATGCTIGNFRFTDFVLGAPAGGAVPLEVITVTPVTVGNTIIGFDFAVSPTSSGGAYFDNLIGYRVTGTAATVSAATVDFSGTSTTGFAAVSVASNLCLGGTFTGPDLVSGCSSGNTLNLAVVNIFDTPDPAYSLAFAPVGSLAVVTDIAFDSGPDGTDASTLTTAVNRFTVTAAPAAVPEPAAAWMLALGGLAALASRRMPARRRTD